MNPLLRGSAAHVFVESLSSPQLAVADDHHLRRVLRIGATDVITLSDGHGAWVTARLEAEGLVVTSAPTIEPAPRPVSVITAIPKGDRPEWIVQKLTEVGATTIGFMHCARSVVRWDAQRAARQVERLRRIGHEAAMQSRRLWLPDVIGVLPFSDAAGAPGCAIADPDGEALGADIDTVLVGPEGGFTDSELGAVSRHAALSAHVLRVETAALTAAILLTLRHGGD